jgi:uncharacterized membrane protein YgcG
MGALDRLRQRSTDDDGAGGGEAVFTEDRSEEEALRVRLLDDPNDAAAFDRLAKIVRSRAVEGHDAGDPQREADDAVWALAEEIAQSSRAWYPLIQLARLSIDDDREVALRRLATAADRDPSGEALAHGLATLREAGHSVDALNLGVGHWRPREHVVEAGRQLIEASIESDRHGEARRHLDAMAAHPDQEGVERLRSELEGRIARAERDVASRRTAGGMHAPVVDTTADHVDPAAPGRSGGSVSGGSVSGGSVSGGSVSGGSVSGGSVSGGASAGAPIAPVDVRDKGSRLMGFLRR